MMATAVMTPEFVRVSVCARFVFKAFGSILAHAFSTDRICNVRNMAKFQTVINSLFSLLYFSIAMLMKHDFSSYPGGK